MSLKCCKLRVIRHFVIDKSGKISYHTADLTRVAICFGMATSMDVNWEVECQNKKTK